MDHVLLEQGGAIHGAALDLLEAAAPGTCRILARMPPQMLVGLDWDEAYVREALGLTGALSSGPEPRRSLSPDGPPPHHSMLPCCGVHLLGVAVTQQHLLDLLVEERPRLRIPRVQAVVVDEQRLVLEPVLPAVGTDLATIRSPNSFLNGCAGHAGRILAAPAAMDRLVAHGVSSVDPAR